MKEEKGVDPKHTKIIAEANKRAAEEMRKARMEATDLNKIAEDLGSTWKDFSSALKDSADSFKSLKYAGKDVTKNFKTISDSAKTIYNSLEDVGDVMFEHVDLSKDLIKIKKEIENADKRGWKNQSAALKNQQDHLKALQASAKMVARANDIAIAKGINVKDISEEMMEPFKEVMSLVDKVPGGGIMRKFFGLDGMLEKVQKQVMSSFVSSLAETGSVGKSAFTALISGAKGLLTALGPVLIPLIAIGATLALIKKAFKLDQEVTDLARGLGISKEEAEETHHQILSIAATTKVAGANAEQLTKAYEDLAKQTGVSVVNNRDMLESQVLLTKQYGMAGDEAAAFQMTAVGNNATTEQLMGTVQGMTEEYNKLTGNALNHKQIAKDIAKVSKTISAAYKGDIKALTKAALQAKSMGMSMEQTAAIANKLLDVEGSIEAEMKANVLTGKSMNMNLARQLALQGDSAGAAAEALKQAGSYDDFLKMNIVQQKAVADAAGMTVDELVNAGQIQKINSKLTGKEIKNLSELSAEERDRLVASGDISEEEAKKLALQEQQVSTQEKMASIMDRINAAFDYMAGVFSPIVDLMGYFADHWNVVGPIVGTIASVLAVSILPSMVNMVKNAALWVAEQLTTVANWLLIGTSTTAVAAETGIIATEQGIIAAETGATAIETGIIAAETGVIAVEQGVVAAETAAAAVAGTAQATAQGAAAAATAATAVGAISTMSALTLGLGAVAIIAGIAAIVGMMSSEKEKAATTKVNDAMIDPDGGLVVKGKKGTYQLNEGDSVIAGTDIGGSGGGGGGAGSGGGSKEQLTAVKDLAKEVKGIDWTSLLELEFKFAMIGVAFEALNIEEIEAFGEISGTALTEAGSNLFEGLNNLTKLNDKISWWKLWELEVSFDMIEDVFDEIDMEDLTAFASLANANLKDAGTNLGDGLMALIGWDENVDYSQLWSLEDSFDMIEDIFDELDIDDLKGFAELAGKDLGDIGWELQDMFNVLGQIDWDAALVALDEMEDGFDYLEDALDEMDYELLGEFANANWSGANAATSDMMSMLNSLTDQDWSYVTEQMYIFEDAMDYLEDALDEIDFDLIDEFAYVDWAGADAAAAGLISMVQTLASINWGSKEDKFEAMEDAMDYLEDALDEIDYGSLRAFASFDMGAASENADSLVNLVKQFSEIGEYASDLASAASAMAYLDWALWEIDYDALEEFADSIPSGLSETSQLVIDFAANMAELAQYKDQLEEAVDAADSLEDIIDELEGNDFGDFVEGFGRGLKDIATSIFGGGEDESSAASNPAAETNKLLTTLIQKIDQPVKINISGRVIDELESQQSMRRSYNTRIDGAYGANG